MQECLFDAGVVFSAEDAAGVPIDPPQLEGADLLQALQLFGEGDKRLRLGTSILTTTLDPSQCRAVLAALTRRVSIIQGPPGSSGFILQRVWFHGLSS